MGCIDVCLDRRKGDSGVKQMLRICLVEAIRYTLGDCWWTVVTGWYFLLRPVWKSIGDALTGKWSWLRGQLVQELGGQGDSMEAEWGTSHG